MRSSGGFASPSEDSAEGLKEFQGYLNSDEEMDFLRSGEKKLSQSGSVGEDGAGPRHVHPPPKPAPFRAWSKANLELIQEEDSLQTDPNAEDTLFNSTTHPNRSSVLLEKESRCLTTCKPGVKTNQPVSLEEKESPTIESPLKKTVPKHPISEFLTRIQLDSANLTAENDLKVTLKHPQNVPVSLTMVSSNENLVPSNRHKSESGPSEGATRAENANRRKGSAGRPQLHLKQLSANDFECSMEFPKLKRRSRSKDKAPESQRGPFVSPHDSLKRPPHSVHGKDSSLIVKPHFPFPVHPRQALQASLRRMESRKEVRQSDNQASLNTSRCSQDGTELREYHPEPQTRGMPQPRKAYRESGSFKDEWKSRVNIFNVYKPDKAFFQPCQLFKATSRSFEVNSAKMRVPPTKKLAAKDTEAKPKPVKKEQSKQSSSRSNQKDASKRDFKASTVNRFLGPQPRPLYGPSSELKREVYTTKKTVGVNIYAKNFDWTALRLQTHAGEGSQTSGNPGKENCESLNVEDNQLTHVRSVGLRQSQDHADVWGSIWRTTAANLDAENRRKRVSNLSSSKAVADKPPQTPVPAAKAPWMQSRALNQAPKWSRSPFEKPRSEKIGQLYLEGMRVKQSQEVHSPFLQKTVN